MSLKRVTEISELMMTFVVVMAAVGLLYKLFLMPPAQATLGPPMPPPTQDVKEMIASAELTNFVGQGQVAIVEFTDFQCPFCAKHAKESFPALKRELIDSGKIRYIVLNLPLGNHPYAIPAAEAAECAATQGRFWEMRHLLFETQGELATADFVAYARELELNTAVFETCLNNHKSLPKMKADHDLAKRLGVTATPTLFIGRMRADGGVDLLKQITGAASTEMFVTEVGKLDMTTG